MSANKQGDPTTLKRLYGRSQGKPLRERRGNYFETVWGRGDVLRDPAEEQVAA